MYFLITSVAGDKCVKNIIQHITEMHVVNEYQGKNFRNVINS